MGTVERPKNHKDLEVWKQSMELVDLVYGVTKSFPPEELYGLPRGICEIGVIPWGEPVEYVRSVLFHGVNAISSQYRPEPK